MAETIYDVAIIGSGPAGYTAAIRAGEYGLKTCLIEKDDLLGGTCLHVGCIPTKALLFNAEIWDHLKNAKEFGIEGVTAPKLNWAAVQQRKNKIVLKHAKGLEFLMRKNKVTTVNGYGRLTTLWRSLPKAEAGQGARLHTSKQKISSSRPARRRGCFPVLSRTRASSPTSRC